MNGVQLLCVAVLPNGQPPIVPIPCYKCPNTFASQETLDVHLITHMDEEQRPETFQLVKDLNQHMKITHPILHSCDKCSKTFPSAEELNIHLTTHIDEERRLPCDQCTEIFKFVKDLKKHKKIKHLTRFSCDKCFKKFSSLEELNLHLDTHTNEEYLQSCDQCNETFKFVKDLKKHKMIKHSMMYPCSKCDEIFQNKWMLRSHYNKHPPQPAAEFPYACELCTERFRFEQNLYGHKRYVHNTLFTCDECGKICIEPSVLKLHIINMHTDEFPFPCNECSKVFKVENKLKAHKKQYHDGSYIPPTCADCGKTFKLQHQLRDHIELLHEGGVLKCPICDKQITKHYMLSHMKIHESEKNVKCEHCGMVFSNESVLQRHISRSHARKPFITTIVCQVCGKEIQKYYFKAHMDMHNGIKEHTCDVCGKQFRTKMQLTIHQRVHTKEKPYECDICKNRFTQRSTLTVHKRIHNGKKPFQCDLCEKAFVTNTLLKYHRKKHEDL